MKKKLSFAPPSVLYDRIVEDGEREGIDRDELVEVLDAFRFMEQEGDDVAVCFLSGALFIRIFDADGYHFPLPVALTDGCRAEDTLTLLSEYAVREMVPLVITEVPREEVRSVLDVFPSVDGWTYEDDDDLFILRVMNECSRLCELPARRGDGVALAPIGAKHLSRYAELCRSNDVNRYWGYDVREDNVENTDEFFLEVIDREFRAGTAVTLGIFVSDELVGEGVLYAFDYRGGASVGLRLLPEYWGRGLGSAALGQLILLADELGISTLRAEVMEENERSLAMTRRLMREISRDGQRVYFSLKLR